MLWSGLGLALKSAYGLLQQFVSTFTAHEVHSPSRPYPRPVHPGGSAFLECCGLTIPAGGCFGLMCRGRAHRSGS
ncbi:hypothetical protein OF83DRAFT_613030 [Amylostereum chailletii]|nr:hypothetical protein OF83DRAFT_613030 [Amylostereum chailletii]